MMKYFLSACAVDMPNDNNALADADTTYTEKQLILVVRKMIPKLDLLKVTINSLDTSCMSSNPSITNLAQVQHKFNIYEVCRKKLHLVINLMETLHEMLEGKQNVDVSRVIDCVYWALKSVKEHLIKLTDPRLTDVVEEVENMIEYANGDIRSIGLDLIKPSIEKTLMTPFRGI